MLRFVLLLEALLFFVQAAPPKKETVPAKTCPNCTTCQDCRCFGGGYYCQDGRCPVSLGTPIRANGHILRRHWDGRQWHQWWELESAPARMAAPICLPGGV